MQDLSNVKIEAVVMNTFHLMQKPGSSTVQAFGGLHKFSGWQGIIITDSGGFQAYSLIRESERFGNLSDRGITFYPEGKNRKFILSPEKSIQLQISYDSNVVICLDDCTTWMSLALNRNCQLCEPYPGQNAVRMNTFDKWTRNNCPK